MKLFSVKDDPILSCNAWIQSNPKALEDAYWKICGMYVYEQKMQVPHPDTDATGMDWVIEQDCSKGVEGYIALHYVFQVMTTLITI